MAWLSPWNRRKSKVINGHTPALTNYQLQIIVHKGAGADTSTDIYLGTNVRDDFGDVRFTDSDGSTLLSYWIDPSSLVSGSRATFWVKIPSVPIAGTAIYLYYDNPTQTTTSNGTNTFLVFDDFSGPSLGQWTQDSGIWTQSAGALRSPVNACGPDWAYIVINTPGVVGTNIMVNVDAQAAGNAGAIPGIVTRYQNSSNNYAHVFRPAAGALWILRSGAAIASAPVSTSPNIFYPMTAIDDNNSSLTATITVGGTTTTTSVSDTTYSNGKVGLGVYTCGTNQGGVFKNFRVRGYTSPEPTFGSTGTEETPTTGDLSISSTPSGAEIYIDNIDQGVTTPQTIMGISAGSHTYRLTKIDYQDSTGSFTITGGQTTTLSISLTPAPCPTSPKYEGNTVHLSAIPRDGTGPYYVEFRKNNAPIATYSNAAESLEVTYDYILTNEDIRTATLGTIDFSVYISDLCPTGAQTCTQLCTINIGCLPPVCNFTVT